MTADD